MRKHYVSRALLFLWVDLCIFVLLASLQFSKKASAVDEAAERGFDPAAFVVPQGADEKAFAAALAAWRDKNFPIWAGQLAGAPDENTVIACLSEALERGRFSAGRELVGEAFLNGRQRTWESAVYLGGLGAAASQLLNAERAVVSRLSAEISEKPLSFLAEDDAAAFLQVRGYAGLLESAAASAAALPPESLALEHAAGVLEGWAAFAGAAGLSAAEQDNPFDGLRARALGLIAEGLKKSPEGDRVFVFRNDRADAAYCLRLGRALLAWAGAASEEAWAGLGRSLISSALSLDGGDGSLVGAVLVSRDGAFYADSAAPRVSSAVLYRALGAGTYHPRQAPLGEGLWAWTAASAIRADRSGKTLDLSLTFPVGETHYLLLRGLGNFNKVQIYGGDYRSDPAFERYNSPGWVYRESDGIFLLKMRHRDFQEHIKIEYD